MVVLRHNSSSTLAIDRDYHTNRMFIEYETCSPNGDNYTKMRLSRFEVKKLATYILSELDIEDVINLGADVGLDIMPK